MIHTTRFGICVALGILLVLVGQPSSAGISCLRLGDYRRQLGNGTSNSNNRLSLRCLGLGAIGIRCRGPGSASLPSKCALYSWVQPMAIGKWQPPESHLPVPVIGLINGVHCYCSGLRQPSWHLKRIVYAWDTRHGSIGKSGSFDYNRKLGTRIQSQATGVHHIARGLA